MSTRVARRAAFVLLSCAAAAWAEGEAPPANDSAVVPQEPQVTITQRGNERVEEYSINNRVYMIKVTPAKGAPYYLVDTTGDGSFDTRRSGLGPDVQVPQWVLFNWK